MNVIWNGAALRVIMDGVTVSVLLTQNVQPAMEKGLLRLVSELTRAV